MIRPLHESDHTVASDGTLSLSNLRPGQRVHVVVVPQPSEEAPWGPGPIEGSRIYEPDQPRLVWGALKEDALGFDEPFAPACDADNSDSANT